MRLILPALVESIARRYQLGSKALTPERHARLAERPKRRLMRSAATGRASTPSQWDLPTLKARIARIIGGSPGASWHRDRAAVSCSNFSLSTSARLRCSLRGRGQLIVLPSASSASSQATTSTQTRRRHLPRKVSGCLQGFADSERRHERSCGEKSAGELLPRRWYLATMLVACLVLIRRPADDRWGVIASVGF
jgi:hypothetical protein